MHTLTKLSHTLQTQKKEALITVGMLPVLLLFCGGYYLYRTYHDKMPLVQHSQKSDVYDQFVMEGYDSIYKNYWAKLSEDKFATLFQLSVQKASNQKTPPVLLTNDRAGVAKIVHTTLSTITSTTSQKQMAVDILTVATYNLEPIGRNGMFSKKQEVALRQNVSNINPTVNLYQNLGVEKGASVAVVEKAYEQKAVVLEKLATPEAKQELQKITHAKKVLTSEYDKKMYDETQIEPTISGKIIGTTLYLGVSKISPTTLREFGIIVDRASTTPRLDSMVIDLRGNIGGALDFLQYFLGAFIGQNQFAFDLFHQDEYQVQRTTIAKFEPLARYKELAILTDNMTQSTAELTAAVFKRLKLATIIGSTTRGWGTVENTFPLTTVIDENEKYSLYLVHSLTLRDDNSPIEGRGVTPDVDVKDKNFKEEVRAKLRNSSLITAIEVQLKSGPLR